MPRGSDGLLLMVASAASFALMAAIVKRWLPDTPTQAVVFSRGVMLTTFLWLLARRRGVPVLGSRPLALIGRGLLGYGALSCYFWSVQHLPLGDAVLLQYSHPIFVALLAPLVLHERSGPWHWFLVGLALFGVALVVGPSGEVRGATVIALCGALGSGLAYIAVRALSRTEHAITIMLWFPLVTIPGGLTGSILAGESALPRDLGEVTAHVAVSAAALLGQVTLTLGLARIDVARGTAATMTGPVFGVLFGLLLFGTVPTITSLVGIVVVTGCSIGLAFTGARDRRRTA